MKITFAILTFIALLLLALHLDLLICGVMYPSKMDIISSYRIPIVGTCAKAKALQILAQLEKEDK